jgi:hypothetical protein
MIDSWTCGDRESTKRPQSVFMGLVKMLFMGLLRKEESVGGCAYVVLCVHIVSRMLSHESIDAANEYHTIISPVGRLLRIAQQVQWTLRCIDTFQIMDPDFLEPNTLLRMRMAYGKSLRRSRGGRFAFQFRKQRFRSPNEIVVGCIIAPRLEHAVVILQLELVEDGLLLDSVLGEMLFPVRTCLTHNLELVDKDVFRSIGDPDIVCEDCRCLLNIFDRQTIISCAITNAKATLVFFFR